MGLRGSIARYAVRHAHVLVVEVPGHWRTRVAVEREVLSRGWRLAESPADADVLAVCGEPGSELSGILERLWEQLPGPRARVDVASPSSVVDRLDGAEADLGDLDRQRDDSRRRDQEPPVGEGDHEGHDQDHDDHDHGDHEQDHGDMDMAPGGIPLAEGGDDRDGLEMDVLHVRLGPVLPAWPAGLVLRCTLQGDLVVEAEASRVDGARKPGNGEPDDVPAAARTCDDVARLLSLAGWPDGADRARRVRDLVLDGDSSAGAALDRLARRLDRARLLRWSLRGVRPLTQGDLDRNGLPHHLEGDVHARLLAMLERAGAQLADPTTATDEPAVPLEALPGLVDGLDLATARLVVASLDLEHNPAREGVTHA
jgi:hypothetical protein